MKCLPRLAMFLPAAVLSITLAGCAVSPSTSGSTSPTGAWQNWQIQAGTAITSPPNTYPNFVGAIQAGGTASAAILSASASSTGSPQALDFTGTYYSSTDIVDLFPATTGFTSYGISYTSATTNAVIPVAIAGGCVYPLNYQGPECLALTSFGPAVGVQVAPLSGTYTGNLSDGTPSMSGTATLTLTQSASPNSSGQFPLSGTLAFPSGSDIGTVPLGGTVAGEGISLSDSSAAPTSPTANVTAAVSPDGSQITISNLLYSNYGPGAVIIYTGVLTRQ